MTRASLRTQVGLFLVVTYVLALAIVLVLPDTSDAAPLLSIFAPVIATAVTIAVTAPPGQRRAAWARIGLGRAGLGDWPAAIGLAAAVAVLSYALAAIAGVARIDWSRLTPDVLQNVAFTLVVFTVILLGEEIGWRGFLLPRLATATTRVKAAFATGAAHAAFHLPLYLLGSTYNSAGSRWIVVPTAMASLTFAGVIYAWLRWRSDSLWPVAVAHNSFNVAFETLGGLAIASSPAALAYNTGETGIATMLLTALTALVLIRRSRVFRGEPGTVSPATGSAGARTPDRRGRTY
jgi:membrane protease YdiL (CAAX protease family)